MTQKILLIQLKIKDGVTLIQFDLFDSKIEKVAQLLQYNMENKQKTQTKKRYSQISLKKRENLVTSVIQHGQSLTRVAKKLKLKLSTAKLILKKFKKTGTLFNKRLRNARKQPNFHIVNPIIEQPLASECKEISILEEKENTISPSNFQKIQNVYQVSEFDVQPVYFLPYVPQQQYVVPWAGCYFVL